MTSEGGVMGPIVIISGLQGPTLVFMDFHHGTWMSCRYLVTGL